MLVAKNIENNTMHSTQELHLFLCSAIFTSSMFSVHSSTNLSANFNLKDFSLKFQANFSLNQSKYFPKSHDLQHSHSQLLGFQRYPLWHTPLSINSLHSHLHLSSFQRCLLLQTLESSLHLHLQVSCHFMCLVALVLDIRLNTLAFKFLNFNGFKYDKTVSPVKSVFL